MAKAVALQSSSERFHLLLSRDHGLPRHVIRAVRVQFYWERKILGTVDFIFGYADAVFQKCTIPIRPAQINKNTNMITAQGRSDRRGTTGFALCTISEERDHTAEYDEPYPRRRAVKTYLGRLWREYAVTIFMECYMSDRVDPRGWLEWNTTFDSIVFYGEYRNNGPGENLHGSGQVERVLSHKQLRHCVEVHGLEFLHKDSWIRASGVPYQGGLTISGIHS